MTNTEIAIHKNHCCILHHCKYVNEECPVLNNLVNQSNTCEDCNEDGIHSVRQARSYYFNPYLQYLNNGRIQLELALELCNEIICKNQIKHCIAKINHIENQEFHNENEPHE